LLAELAEKNRDLERYLYVASHDLRSPLVNVQGFGAQIAKAAAELTRLLADEPLETETRKRVDEILAQRVPRAMSFIVAATGRMDRLINGLLKLSRTGRAELTEAILDMNALLSDAAASIRHQLDEAKAELRVADLPPCLGDKDLISAAIANILDNAVKYRSAARALVISVEGRAEGRWIVYRIDDTGPGIPPEQREKVFELFYRYGTEHDVAGDGIGLAQVKKILERHGGSVRADEAPGGGTRIELRLPAPTRTTARSPKIRSAD
jgi:signal transduction histidine kinase